MDNGSVPELSVSEFVTLFNQTLEFAYPDIVILGELANLRVSKNRWVYFDLKDESATVKFFGTVYQLPGPLEDGMLLKVRGQPRLHNLYGFSVNIESIQPAGEGTIRRAAELLQAKLAREGIFEESRKRVLPYPPRSIGLITSKQSAAFADFTKIINARWQGMTIELIDTQVQGDIAPIQIVAAIEQFNASAEPPEVLVLIRGGGSPEDLAAFNTEVVTRAVATSRVPIMAAIGHEIDVSLAELAADRRASTPSNAAEFLVPERSQAYEQLRAASMHLQQLGTSRLRIAQTQIEEYRRVLDQRINGLSAEAELHLHRRRQLLAALNPDAILRRGYAIVRSNRQLIRGMQQVSTGVIVDVQLHDGHFAATVNHRQDVQV